MKKNKGRARYKKNKLKKRNKAYTGGINLPEGFKLPKDFKKLNPDLHNASMSYFRYLYDAEKQKLECISLLHYFDKKILLNNSFMRIDLQLHSVWQI